MSYLLRAFVITVASMFAAGCSLRTLAINKTADVLSGGGTTFASDDDPELIEQALPFSLKMIESVLAETPRHRALLLAAASGFTQYSYAFVQQEAERVEATDIQRSLELSERAARLYVRARDYGLRGLTASHPGIDTQLRSDAAAAVRALRREDVPLAYWTAVSWGAAISLSKTPDIVADQPAVEALIDRVLELDEGFDSGAIHSFLISYEPSRQGAQEDYEQRCRLHFSRAVEASGGQLASPYVALAEAVSQAKQNREEFEELLRKALAIDPDQKKDWRLANLVAQKRARWLLSRCDELFVAGTESTARRLPLAGVPMNVPISSGVLQ